MMFSHGFRKLLQRKIAPPNLARQITLSRNGRAAIRNLLISFLVLIRRAIGPQAFTYVFGLYCTYLVSDLKEIRRILRSPTCTWKFKGKNQDIALRVLLVDSRLPDVVAYLKENASNKVINSSGIRALLVACDILGLDATELLLSPNVSGIKPEIASLLRLSTKIRSKLNIGDFSVVERNLLAKNSLHFRALVHDYGLNGMVHHAESILQNLFQYNQSKTVEGSGFYHLMAVPWTISIGHYVFIDIFIKAILLGFVSKRPIYLEFDRSVVCNEAIHEAYAKVIKDVDLAYAEGNFADGISISMELIMSTQGPMEFLALRDIVDSEWRRQRRDPLISFKKNDSKKWRTKIAEELGIPEGAWFVTLHVRETGYRPDPFGETGSTRNADIDDYAQAVSRIVERGGYVVRCGDSTMKPFRQYRVIDYAHLKSKSASLDIVLLEYARFHIGTNSGLSYIPLLFEKPVLYTNDFPLLGNISSDNCVTALQMVWSTRDMRYLSLEELGNSNLVGPYGDGRLLERNRFVLRKNEPELLVEMVVDVLNALDEANASGVIQWSKIGRAVTISSKYRKPFQIRMSNAFLERFGQVLRLDE